MRNEESKMRNFGKQYRGSASQHFSLLTAHCSLLLEKEL
jgi:hypothetical protein